MEHARIQNQLPSFHTVSLLTLIYPVCVLLKATLCHVLPRSAKKPTDREELSLSPALRKGFDVLRLKGDTSQSCQCGLAFQRGLAHIWLEYSAAQLARGHPHISPKNVR